eukprot:12412603-Karenia_brevis.AAC.1
MFDGFLRSLTNPTKVLPQEEMLSESDICGKTFVFLADGASSMGVRHRGTSATTAVAGDNFFYLLQKKVDEVLGADTRPVIGYWLDVVASDAETQVAYTADLPRFLRSVISHIVASDRAKGLLDYIALLLEPPAEGDGVASQGSLSSVWFAPQRWLSTVKPMQTLVDKMEHLLMYMLELYLDPWHACQEFGGAMMEEFKDFRLHLVLPGILDINIVLDEANKALQHLGINIWAAAGIRRTINVKLEDLILRQKTTETHKKKSKIIEAAAAWFKGELTSRPLTADPCNFEKALTKLRLVKKAGGNHKVLYTVQFKDRVQNSAGAVVKKYSVEMDMPVDLLPECMAILRKYAHVVTENLDKRFSNTSLVDDAVAAFSAEYDHSKDPEPTPSLQRLAKHAKSDYATFHKAWEHLQHEKENYIQSQLQEAAVLKGLTRADMKATEVWPVVLCKVDSNPESLQQSQPAKASLEEFLLIEPTNASVERDANIVRLIRDTTNNKAEADLLDAR